MEAICLHYTGGIDQGDNRQDDVLGERGPSLYEAGKPRVSQSHPLTISPTGALPFCCTTRIVEPQILAVYFFATLGPLLQFPPLCSGQFWTHDYHPQAVRIAAR